ncbi:family 43 glycosylhydrolase [Paenibacillus sp. NRS-1782]|uniref:family 43 glycosylhydrolase n=1 Tax=unclassified Paenibacillus TaxID=185978 RepID=UPI003D26EB69
MDQIFNPFLPLNEYIPDVEPHVFGDRVYVYGSHDREGGTTFCELDYVVYSADVKDLTDWRCEGTIYSASQDPHSKEVVKGAGERKYLYAPDVVQGNDGRYYLYYCLAAFAGKGGFDGPISVAVCDTPAGKYEYYGDVKYTDGRLMLRYIPFDPAVINDDGRIYLYYGWALPVGPTNNALVKGIYNKVMQGMLHKTMEEIKSDAQGIMGANVVELEADMLTVKSEPKRIIPCEMEAKGTEFKGHAFFEASSIRKIGATYYFIYSSFVNHELCYATSIYPDREFQYGGVIISNGDIGMNGRDPKDRLTVTGNNHGSIECINGNWYIFYHRHTHMSSNSRQACAEQINILKDGSIPQVEMTSCGLNSGPLQATGEYPAVIACNLTDGHMPHMTNGSSKKKKPHITHRAEERFLTNISTGTLLAYKYFDFQGSTKLTVKTRGPGSGTLIISNKPGKKLAEIKINSSESWKLSSTHIELNGMHALYFTFKGKNRIELLSFSFF